VKNFDKGNAKWYSITPELSYTCSVELLNTGQIFSVTRRKDKRYGSKKKKKVK